MKMSIGPAGHRNCGTIGPQGIRGEKGCMGPIGPTGPQGPEGLTRSMYENSIVVRGVDDPLKGLKFDLSNIAPSTVVHHKVPGITTELVGTTTLQKLINKDLTDSSNTSRATQLASGESGSVTLPEVMPEVGQVLLAIADQKTKWEYPDRLMQVSTFAFSVYKDIVQTTIQANITQYDQVKLNQPEGAFNASEGIFNITRNGLFVINFTANASTDENATTFYIDLMKDEEIILRQQVSIGHGVNWQLVTISEVCLLNAGNRLYLRVTPGVVDTPSITLCCVNFNGICSAAS